MSTRLTLPLIFLLIVLGSGSALAAYDFAWHLPQQGSVSELSILNSFHTEVINTGDQSDTYTVTLGKNHPPDWVSSLCVGTTCYLPWIVEIEFTLAPGDTAILLVDLTPLDVGSGGATASVTSQGNAALTHTEDFSVLTAGLDVLVVASDNGGGHDSWYTDAVGATDKSSGVWHRQQMGALTQTDLQAFAAVMWLAGNHSGSLDAADRTALDGYLQAGGKLFLSGRDLAWENCNPASPYYSTASLAWFNQVLGASYAGTLAPTFDHVEGLATEPVGTGLSFDIFGGDGADNAQYDFDTLTTTAAGQVSLFYVDANPGGIAGIRHHYGPGQAYTLGFGFEAIATQADRDLLMGRIISWFDGQLVPAGDLVQPLLTGLARAVPNPFNPRTNIRFEVGGDGATAVDVTVYDLHGRIVRHVFQGNLAPGPQSLGWDGRDNRQRNLPAGIYLARIRTAGPSQVVKMTLAK